MEMKQDFMEMKQDFNVRGALRGSALMVAAGLALVLVACSDGAPAAQAGAAQPAGAAEAGAAQSAPAAGAAQPADAAMAMNGATLEQPAAGDAVVNHIAVVGDDGIARVGIEAGRSGFVPDSVHVVAGQATDLVFTRTSPSRCVADVHIPDLGIGRTDLVLDQPVNIRIQPEQPGRYQFLCGMDMLRGTIIVTPARAE
jgi:plastocyanin